MEEILENVQEPETVSENSCSQKEEGQAEKVSEEKTDLQAPSELILGKFKSVEDLTKAYKELEKFQGTQSEELGLLRQKATLSEDLTKAWEHQQTIEKAKESKIVKNGDKIIVVCSSKLGGDNDIMRICTV